MKSKNAKKRKRAWMYRRVFLVLGDWVQLEAGYAKFCAKRMMNRQMVPSREAYLAMLTERVNAQGRQQITSGK